MKSKRTIDELSRAIAKVVVEIKDCAIEVYGRLGGGFREDVYEQALGIEFRHRGIHYDNEENIEVFYKNEKVGMHRVDFIIMDFDNPKIPLVAVEIKAQPRIYTNHVSQLNTYMKTLSLPEGIVINFPYPNKPQPQFRLTSNPNAIKSSMPSGLRKWRENKNSENKDIRMGTQKP